MNSSIWLIDQIQTAATTLGQNEPEVMAIKGLFNIPKSSKTGTSSSDSLVTNQDNLQEESFTHRLMLQLQTAGLRKAVEVLLNT